MASPVKKNLELGLCGHQPKTAMGFQSPIHYEGSLEWTNNLLEPCRGTHCLTPQFPASCLTISRYQIPGQVTWCGGTYSLRKLAQ